ncbi:MAG: hypothetical protein R2844_05540 [Caldilineales bacterium]
MDLAGLCKLRYTTRHILTINRERLTDMIAPTTPNAASRHRLARVISWLLLMLAVLTVVATVVLQAVGCRVLIDPTHAEPALAFGTMMLPLNILAFALLGTLINTFRPENRFGWLANLYATAMGLALFADSYGLCGFEARVILPGSDYAVWTARLIELYGFLCLALMPWLFPDGRFVSPRWRTLGLAGVGLIFLLNPLRAVLTSQLRVDSFGRQWIENPLALDLPGSTWMASLRQNLDFIIMVMFMAGIVSVLLRWRRSSGEARQQIKWLAFFFAISGFLFLGVETIGQSVYPAIFNGWFYLIVLATFWLGLPLAMGLAVFKYRLYDIDLVIRKTLVYAILTTVLALVYFGSVILLSGILSQLTGQQSALAIVVSTLIIAHCSRRCAAVSRTGSTAASSARNTDAQRVLAQFADCADETDLDVDGALVQVYQETMQPEHVSVAYRSRSWHG